jgi:cytosine/adenosine deaminase-related metal-dependent hydrolase
VILYRARCIAPVTRPPFEHGVVAVDGGRIAYVGARDGAPAGEEHDLGDVILTPGLVNTHTHLELTVMRGFLEDLRFWPWIRTLTVARRDVLSEAHMLDASRWGILESLRSGTTTIADTSSSGTSMQAMRELGVRGVMYQEVFGPAREQFEESMAGLRASVQRHRALENELVRVGVSPHAVYSVSDELFAETVAYALLEKLPIAIHAAESAEEEEFVRDWSGPFADALRARGITVAPSGGSPIGHLADLGVLIARPLLIHCARVDAHDIGMIAAARCSVAHCPASNAKLGHGIAPVMEMLEAGIPVGLGTDSVASNNRMDVLDEGRLAILMQRVRKMRPDVLSASMALELATMGGARALGLEARIGSLDVGKDADMAAFALDVPNALPMHDTASALMFALSGRDARFVCIAGNVRVRDGAVIDADLALPGRIRAIGALLGEWRAARRARPSDGIPSL